MDIWNCGIRNCGGKVEGNHWGAECWTCGTTWSCDGTRYGEHVYGTGKQAVMIRPTTPPAPVGGCEIGSPVLCGCAECHPEAA